MVLFVSDIHFGRDDYQQERTKEADLLSCLRSHASDIDHLFLVGDVFDAFIEYRELVPKGFIRFLALLAAWTDRDIPVTYLVGNHDPWHLDFFEHELGVRVVDAPVVTHLAQQRVHVEHGDGIHRAERAYRLLKPWLRHSVAVRLYRTVLPADSGMRLARWVSRHGDSELDPEKARDLRLHARDVLTHDLADVVVLGHSHQPEHRVWPEGQYINLGAWAQTRTFATLDEDGPKLWRWNGDCALDMAHDG